MSTPSLEQCQLLPQLQRVASRSDQSSGTAQGNPEPCSSSGRPQRSSTERCLCRAHSWSSTWPCPHSAAVQGSRGTAQPAQPSPARSPAGLPHSPGLRQARRARPGRAGQGGAGPRKCGRAPPWPRERFLRRSEAPACPPRGEGWRGEAAAMPSVSTEQPHKGSARQQPGGPARTAGPQGGSRTAGVPSEVQAGALSVGAGRGSRCSAGGPGAVSAPLPPRSHLGRSAGRWQLTAGSTPHGHRGD